MSTTPMHILVNPRAAHGKAGRKASNTIAAVREAIPGTVVIETASPLDAQDYIAALDHQPATVVAVGGDGTMNRIGGALVDTPHTLGVIPAGTGNDFANLFGLKKEEHIVQSLLHGTPRTLDTGMVRWTDTEGEHAHPFVNSIGCGFDAAVAGRMKSASTGSGILPYLVNVFRELKHMRQPRAHIHIDGATRERDILLIAVGNGVSSGGGFKITPHALPDDGQLDVCVASGVTIGRVLRVLPETFWGGHLRHPEIEYDRVTLVSFEVAEGIPIHADGEYIASAATEVSAEVRPSSLKILLDNRIMS